MSLPTTIIFLDDLDRYITEEFYNAGWWVPDTVGKDIASLYQAEEGWKCVYAYNRIYDNEGYPIGEFETRYSPVFYTKERCLELREELDNPRPKERKVPEKLAERKKEPNHNEIQIRRVLLPMIRKIMPSTIASELVGVQPMSEDALKEMRSVFTVKYDSTPQEDRREHWTGDTSFHRLEEGDRVKILRPMGKDLEGDNIGTITNRDGEYILVMLDKHQIEVERYPNELQRIRV